MTRRVARSDATRIPIHLLSISHPVGFSSINWDAVAGHAAQHLGAERFASLTPAAQDAIRQFIEVQRRQQVVHAQQTSERLGHQMMLALEVAGVSPPLRLANDAREARDMLIRGEFLPIIEPYVKRLRALTDGKRGPVRSLVPAKVVDQVADHLGRFEAAVRQFRGRTRPLPVEDRYGAAERFLNEVLTRPPRGATLRRLKTVLVTRRPSEIVDELLAWECDPSGGTKLRRQIMATCRQIRRESRSIKQAGDS